MSSYTFDIEAGGGKSVNLNVRGIPARREVLFDVSIDYEDDSPGIFACSNLNIETAKEIMLALHDAVKRAERA